MIKKYGVIDFGTNSARLMISSFNGETIETVSKVVNTIRLGDGMTDGIITRGAIERAEKATLEFLEITKRENVEKTFLFATSAVRDATNSKEFASHIKKTTGCDIDIISGDLEAKIGFLGATYRTNERVGLIDVGGGSTEVVFGQAEILDFAKSFQIGIVRLLQKYPTAGPKNLNVYDDCEAEILKMFKDVPQSLHHKKWLGIGGTATAIAAIKLKLVEYDPKKVDNFYLPIDELNDILSAMKHQTAEQRKSLTGLEERRADVIVFGAMILSVFLKMVNADGIYACESDNLEGYLLKKLGVF